MLYVYKACEIDLTEYGPLQAAMKSPRCDTLYVTEVLAEFEADTFFPPIDPATYQLIE